MSDQNQPKFVPNAFWQEVLDTDRGGSGGIISHVTIATGWKVYSKGLTNESSFFPAPQGNKHPQNISQKQAAFAAAKQAGVGRASWAINILAPVAESWTRGVQATWKGDRYFTYDVFTSAIREVVMPSLQNNGINSMPWNGWVRLGFRDDPFGTKETGQDGEERTKQVAYVIEVFPNQAAAMAAVKAAAGDETPDEASEASGTSAFPPGYDAATWAQVLPMLKAELAKGKSAADVASVYGMPVVFVLPLMNS